MSSAGAIRAGAAYVEVFLEQNAVTRGLSSLQSRLRGWSASLGRMGAGAYGGALPGPLGAIANFASSPAGMFAGLLTAAKIASSAGDEMVHLAEKAGTSVESISALAYAARRTDVDAVGLATSIKKMQVNIVAAARGGKEAQEAFAAIGMTAGELGRLLPEEQFRRIADKIAAIQNPAERAAAAVKIFGRNGTELLPLLLQGADGIAQWEGLARALGLVANGEAAEGAHRFSLLLGDLHDVMISGVKVIGGAIIPELTRFVHWIVKGTAAARDWIKDHKGIVIAALQVTGAIVAGGIALSVLSAMLRNMAGAVGLVLIPLRLLSSLLSGVVSVASGVAAAIAGAAWSTAAVVAHVAWAALGVLGSLLGVAFSAAALVASLAWTVMAAVAGVAWTVASVVASAAWVAGSVVVSAAWSVLTAIPGLLAIAWSTAATVASAAWTAVAFALDAVLTFAATGAMALPALIVAGVIAGIALLGAEIYFQLTRSVSKAPEIGKQAGEKIGAGVKDGIEASTARMETNVGVGLVASMEGAANAAIEGFRQGATTIGGYFSQLWRDVGNDASETFGLIGKALMTGNIAGAWPVLTALAKLEWQRISLYAQACFAKFLAWWSENKSTLTAPVISMAEKLKTVLDFLKDQIEAIGTLYSNVFGRSTTFRQDRFAEFKQSVKEGNAGFSPEEKVKAIDAWLVKSEEFKKRQIAKQDTDPHAKGRIEEENDKQQWMREERARILAEAPAGGEQPAGGDADPFAAQRKAIQDAAAELEQARKRLAEDMGKPANQEDVFAGKKVDLPDISNLAAAKASVEGTFSGYALGGLGGGDDVQVKMEGHLAEMKVAIREGVVINERIEARLGEGMALA